MNARQEKLLRERDQSDGLLPLDSGELLQELVETDNRGMVRPQRCVGAHRTFNTEDRPT